MVNPAGAARLLSDPTRVRILDELAGGPQRTAALAASAGMSPAAVSRHLQLLRNAGLIERLDVEDDGRGRAYRVQPAALAPLAAWIRSTTWSVELSTASTHALASEMLERIGGFLDAFANGDVGFFERHLRADAALVFPGLDRPVDKEGCLGSVSSHAPYTRHRILSEPILQPVGPTATVITLLAEVGTAADTAARPIMITAVVDEGDPWQLVHLQWTPVAPTDKEGFQ